MDKARDNSRKYSVNAVVSTTGETGRLKDAELSSIP